MLQKKGDKNMLNEEICKLRDKLNRYIVENKNYDTILKVSVELDQLIAQHYEKKEEEIINHLH